MDPQPVYRPRAIRSFSLIYLSALLYSSQFFFVFFINSSFLSVYFSGALVGLLFSIGAFLNLFIFLNIGKILNRTGNYGLMLSLIFLEIISLFVLAYSQHPLLLGICFVLTQIINPILLFNLDIFLERVSKNEETGSIRGVFLTILNLPPVFIPFVATLLITGNDYSKVYLAAGAFLIPLFYIVATGFRDFNDETYHETNSTNLAKELQSNPNVYDILWDNFLLNFFFAWMTIYMPIYLHLYIGFSWPEIGIMFSIMLLPFLIFQFPLGKLEDKRYGEKEVLIVGFVLLAIFTVLIPYIQSANFLLWTAILFLTRVGASFIEVSAETYFFKQISASNIHLIGLFRLSRNLPYIFVPAIVSIFLIFVDYKFIFLVLGLLMLSGLRYAFHLKDTR